MHFSLTFVHVTAKNRCASILQCRRIEFICEYLCYFRAFNKSSAHNFGTAGPIVMRFGTKTETKFLCLQTNFHASTPSHRGTTERLLCIFAIIHSGAYNFRVFMGFFIPNQSKVGHACAPTTDYPSLALKWVTRVLPPRITLRLRSLSITVAFHPLCCFTRVILD